MSTGDEVKLLQLSEKEKFNGRDWMAFRFRIEQFMQLAECWDIVFHTNDAGVRVCSARPATAADRPAWDKATRRAKAIITTNLGPAVIIHVMTTVTALDTWNALVSVYESTTGGDRAATLRKWHRLEWESDNNMNSYIERAKTLIRQVKVSGETLTPLSGGVRFNCVNNYVMGRGGY